MRFRWLAAMAAVFLLGSAAHAQVGGYVTPIFDHISNSQVDNTVFSFLGAGQKSNSFFGVGFGGYYDFFHSASGKFEAGADARIGIVRGDNAPLNSFILGPRLVYHPEHSKWRPYAEVLGGVGSTAGQHNHAKISRAMFEVVAGADYPIAKHVDVRAIEIGYGGLQTSGAGTFNANATSSQPTSQVLQVSAGLVIRF